MSTPLDPAMLMKAYAAGIFPMAECREAKEVYWVEPKRRGILPLEGFHLSRSLAKLLKCERFETTCDAAFADVVKQCAAPAPDRDNSWINDQIEAAVSLLHASGHAHSIETWQDGRLVGGLYGIRLGRAFFGESMFSRTRDASKVALAHLVARLRLGGFTLLDCQFLTPHLASLGAIEIARADYVSLLSSALSSGSSAGADFRALDLPPPDAAGSPPRMTVVSGPVSGKRIVQALAQTS
jgi:leucyl/phenylalanyl-tRNA---protein transferase